MLSIFCLKFTSVVSDVTQRKCKCGFTVYQCNLTPCIMNFLTDLDLEQLSWQGLTMHWRSGFYYC